MSCQFLSDVENIVIGGETRRVRLLKITFTNGYQATIYVTPDEHFQFGHTGAWHYEVNNGRITLTAKPTNSVKVLGLHEEELAHDTITDWPLNDS